jgi:hypothetical protein
MRETKKRKRDNLHSEREKEESAYRTAMREIHTHTLDKKIFCGCTRKEKPNKRIDSILWQKKEREKRNRTSIYKVNTNENHCSSS